MAKPTDIRNRLGAPMGPTPTPGSTISLTKPAPKAGEEHKNTAPKPDMGHTTHKPGKAQGGAGGSSARPKV
jgi:hypothetical protein